ncbi:uncharacterized protein K452DRAFT_314696 [Aplosporella prunicola CBS 121167]|uniref:ABM domain-containing protein n=1 Tax=Aplosporella prunicola CBS 121167 TaxID=1176127 RepID=A0A6A6BUS8_9PEZI|nr:uncharacterized protein K452DRAFT_314696 [Aplosporella prunicola CBS 121167]KAF2147578.1 hypothetical protein K452DRAFT_314696 [Aplosporella prunicola CBS 121167]
MAPITEIAILPLAAGAAVEDASSPAGQIWNDTLRTVLGRDGAQRAYWGRELENPSTLRLFVDWETLEHHQRFIADASYAPFVKHLLQILDGAPLLYHSQLSPSPPAPALSDASAPATELLTVYFPSDLSAEDAATIEANIAKLTAAIVEHGGSVIKGAAGGWVVETLDYDAAKVEGGKAKAYVACVGWESVDAHVKFRDTDAFKQNITLLREAPQLKGVAMAHAKLVEAQAPAGV